MSSIEQTRDYGSKLLPRKKASPPSRAVLTKPCTCCGKDHALPLFVEVNGIEICTFCAQAANAKKAEAHNQHTAQEQELLRSKRQAEARKRMADQARARKQQAEASRQLQREAKEAEAKRRAEFDAKEEAKLELARRELARRHLLPFVQRFNDKYEAGWVHKDICQRLEKFSDDVAAKKSPRLMLFLPPRHGKLLADSTPVLTTQGWKPHGDLRVGDKVFHPSGRPVEVIALSEKAPAKWRVTFSNGQVIQCHENHEWTIFDRTTQSIKTVETNWFTRTTKRGKALKLLSGNRSKYQLPEVQGVEFPEAELPMHPYVLGAWLGDGSRGKGCITHDVADQPVIDRIESLGYAQSARCVHKTTGVVTTYFSGPRPGVAGRMLLELRELCVEHNKFIPEMYLRSSTEQRLQLLAGLMDTDGHCDKNSRCRFTTADRRLADGVLDLATTLGFRPYLTVEQPKLSSSGIQGRKEYYVVGFQPTTAIPCALPRKRPQRYAPQRRIGITAVTYAPTGETGRCIQVDSDDGLYLAGTTLVPTHNSELASRTFPAWHLGRYPHHEFIGCSYSGALAMDFSRKVRELLRDPAYAPVFPGTKLDKDSQSAERWNTSSAGGYVAAGVGGPITGRGAHILVIDDPVKNREDAESESTRASIWDWYTSTAYTRLAPGGGVLVVLTRWHDDDLAGRLLAKARAEEGDAWDVIEYPALALEDEAYRRKDEALHPDRYDEEALARIRRAVGERDWWALYQQRPTAEDGDFFNKQMIRYYSAADVPAYDQMRFYTAWDLAIGQKESNDWSVGITVGVDRQHRMWVMDIQRGRWDAMELVDKIIDTWTVWRSEVTGIERGHIEMTLGPFLDKRIRERQAHGLYYEALKTGRRDKLARARSIQGRMQQGMVLLREKDDAAAALVQELLRFPNGVHDDQVDALAWLGLMLDNMTGVRAPAEVKKVGWRERLLKRSPTKHRGSGAMGA